MHTCCQCGKQIKGKMTYVSVSRLAQSFGDFSKAYHPKCYERAEREAAKKLGKQV